MDILRTYLNESREILFRYLQSDRAGGGRGEGIIYLDSRYSQTYNSNYISVELSETAFVSIVTFKEHRIVRQSKQRN